MMGEQANPDDSVDYILPTSTSPAGTGYVAGALHDHLGIPINIPDMEHNNLFGRAYNLIFNEWFRDQNLQNAVPVDTDDGPDNPVTYAFTQLRGKRHDYFTSALPWPQKHEEILLPLGTQAPITGLGSLTQNDWDTSQVAVYETGQSVLNQYPVNKKLQEAPGMYVRGNADETAPEIYANLQDATAATINQLRQAFQVQKMYERDARGGTRYTEIIKSHFGVSSPDMRLQRPEYLGGGSTAINMQTIHSATDTNDLTQTAPGTGAPLGKLSGVGTISLNNHGFTKSFTEHCVIIGLVNVRADITYQQGLNRMFSRSDRLDFFWPALSHLGEQEVLNKEIYAQGTAEDNEIFGYQERFAEYRYKPSTISGLLRSTYAQSLDAWHLSQEFTDLPTLGTQFITDQTPLDRCIAVPEEPHFIADFYHKLITARPMPLFGVPGNIDRF